MKYTIPSSVKDFRCKAGECQDNCCIGWEIDIDPDTANHYRKISGEFGKKLQKNILFEEISCFKLDSKERCPFLNSKNLCEIIINLGEEHLCQICRDHPRYFEWFEDLKEGGVGLCCEKAAEMIISSEDHSFVTVTSDEKSEAEYDHKLFDFMFDSRKKIMDHINRSDISLSAKISSVLDFCENIQTRCDNGDYKVPDISCSSPSERSDIRDMLSYIGKMEPINSEWPERIHNLTCSLSKIADFTSKNTLPTEAELYLSNIFNYFIWRHFMKGVFDGEFLSRVKFAASGTAVIFLMFCDLYMRGEFSPEKCACAAKDFSKEIEYCEENLNNFLDDTYEFDFLTSEKIKGLFF